MFFIDPPYPDSMDFDRLSIYLPVQDITQIPLTARPQTLIALVLVLTASFIITINITNTVVEMARKKRSSAARAAALVDARPETSPYASPTCTLPFASPLNVPQEVLLKSPKLLAAYESNLPELPQISEDVGHVLVHYLYTGKYETLKPKPVEDISKQIVELKTSIQAYAAARAFELPELMRLAEAQIEKFGEGLPLPTLLEVARDAHPSLTDSDNWFLDFLRARIRPHLRDAKALRETDLLDRISCILSPNRVLLRTVLELFCENIARAPTPPPAAAPHTPEKQQKQVPQSEQHFSSPINSPITSPITSPETSRAGSPLPPVSSIDQIDLRSRSVPRDDSFSSSPKRKTPTWSSLDQSTILEEIVPTQVSAEPTEVSSLPLEEAQSKPVFDLDDIIADDEPEHVQEVVEEPKKKNEFMPLLEEKVASPAPEPEVVAAPAAEAEPEPEVEDAPAVEAESEVNLAVEPEIPEPILAPEVEAEVEATPAPEVVRKEAPFPITIPQKQRERADSAKVLDIEPTTESGEFKALPILEEVPVIPIPIPASMPALESSSIKRTAFRQADSGFWDSTPSPSIREHSSSVVEIEGTPVVVEPEVFSVAEAKAELEAAALPHFKNEDAEEKIVDAKEEDEVLPQPTADAVDAEFFPRSLVTSPTLLPTHFDLPAEILEAASLPIDNIEPETKENEKEKSVSPPAPIESSTEEAQTTAQSDLPAPAAAAVADSDVVPVPAPTEKDVDAPSADDATGSSDAKASEPQSQQPQSEPTAELAPIPEQLEPVEASEPIAEHPKPAAAPAVEVVPAVSAVQQVAKPTPTSSSASLHISGLRGLRKSRSRRSHRGSTVSLPAADAAQAAEHEAGAKDAPIPVPAPAPAKVSGATGWKKKWLRYPVLFGRGM
ncbi:hypothetical protein QBC43DRAFT_112213 [Cladorrhinum sp. PSN259]|nr:hypothetical protein QBC43DRAFT_112213 [Cladorrhinum sp. PSN259]